MKGSFPKHHFSGANCYFEAGKWLRVTGDWVFRKSYPWGNELSYPTKLEVRNSVDSKGPTGREYVIVPSRVIRKLQLHPRNLTWQWKITNLCLGETSSTGPFSSAMLVFRKVHFPILVIKKRLPHGTYFRRRLQKVNQKYSQPNGGEKWWWIRDPNP